MASSHQQAWNRPHTWTIVSTKPEAVSRSWWVCPDKDFNEEHAKELHRIVNSPISVTLRPMLLGGKLP